MREQKLYSISINNRKEKELGILVSEGEEWILLKSIFTDYVIDGFKLINKQHILSIDSSDKEVFTEKVLKANNKWEFHFDKDIPLTSIALFDWIRKKEITIQISLRDEKISYLGKIDSLSPKSFYLKLINSKGVWEDYTFLFRFDSIRVIEMDTDYINSLLAYNAEYIAKSTMQK